MRILLFISLILIVGCAGILKNNLDLKSSVNNQELHQYLVQFQKLEKDLPGPFSFSVQVGEQKSPHLLVGCMIHGDEVGCLPAVLDFIESIRSKKILYQGQLTVFIGNPEAAKQNRRFIEQDLNRVFLESAPDSLEKKRASEISRYLSSADLFIDLHQTIEPTVQSFYSVAFNEESYLWAKYLEGAKVFVTRPVGESFAQNVRTITEFAIQNHIPSFTLELSQKGFTQVAYEQATRVLRKAVTGLNQLKSSHNITELKNLSKHSPQLRLYKRVYSEPFRSEQMQLRSGYKNFSKVKQGDQIGVIDGHNLLIASKSGYLLFPKYPKRDEEGRAIKPLPSDLFLILQEAQIKDFIQ